MPTHVKHDSTQADQLPQDFLDLVRAMTPTRLGNVKFWVDETRPHAKQLSYDPAVPEWDLEAVNRDLNTSLSSFRLLYCDKDGEQAICMGWSEFCSYRQVGWSGTDKNNRIADALNSLHARDEAAGATKLRVKSCQNDGLSVAQW